MNLKTLLTTDSSQAFRLVYLTLIKFLVLTPASLLLLLVFHLLENRILWTKWWLGTITTMGGKLHSRHQRITQRISTLIS